MEISGIVAARIGRGDANRLFAYRFSIKAGVSDPTAVALAIAGANLPIPRGSRFEGNSSLDRTRKRRAAVSDRQSQLALEVFEAQVVQKDVA